MNAPITKTSHKHIRTWKVQYDDIDSRKRTIRDRQTFYPLYSTTIRVPRSNNMSTLYLPSPQLWSNKASIQHRVRTSLHLSSHSRLSILFSLQGAATLHPNPQDLFSRPSRSTPSLAHFHLKPSTLNLPP